MVWEHWNYLLLIYIVWLLLDLLGLLSFSDLTNWKKKGQRFVKNIVFYLLA